MDSSAIHIVIAHNQVGHSRQYQVTHSWVKAVAFGGFLLMLLTSAVFIDFVGLIPAGHEHDRLTAENKALKMQELDLRHRLDSRANEVAHYKQLIEKLRSITTIGEDGQKVDQPIGGPSREPASLTPREGEPLLDFASRAVLSVQVREQEMATMWDLLSDRQNFLLATPTLLPTKGHFSSGFGLRLHPIKGKTLLHTGLDIGAPWGSQVFAPADGVVSYAGYESGYGNMVSIDHGYGVLTRFAHNSKIFVRTGQKVHRMDVISAVGSTGHSTGPHLHYEVIVRGMPVDPINYILQEP